MICKEKPPVRRISINLPYLNEKAKNTDQSKTVYESLAFLMKKYEYALKEVGTLYDFRFEDSSKLTSNNLAPEYRLTETIDDDLSPIFNVYKNDCLLFQYSLNTYSCANSIFPFLRKPAIERLGMNVISFTDDVITESHSTIPVDAVEFCLREISSIYLTRGYVVKNIALATVFAMRGLFLDELFPTNILKKEAQLQVYMKYLCIESIPLSTFTVTDVANILNISCTQLRRLSQKVYGMPLKQYVLSKKMKNAVLIMTKHPNMTIKEISESVGIEDPKYFSRLFHKQMGCSCSEYYNTIKTDKKK